ncbi:protease prsW family-domain-containing protein [Exophiala viscosa]|uniref:protease prsW family-domain-containing protein n=1 Tax=Exophiala viscosa TaxID=2486360 RepID=UPI00218F9A44|nr:protease prsW family-domain-containing protein [Exophiala viscosa]
MAGLLEEGLKYWALIAARKYGKVTTDRDYLIVPVTAAVGFATVENIATAYGAFRNKETKRLVLTIVERTVFGIPGHAMTAALTGVNVLARDTRLEPLTTWQALQQSVLLHGLSDFTLFAISAYRGNIGWVPPQGKTEICFTLSCVVGIQLWLVFILRGKLSQCGIVL